MSPRIMTLSITIKNATLSIMKHSIKQSIVLLSVGCECHIQAFDAQCHYAECRYAECRGAELTSFNNFVKPWETDFFTI